MNYTALIIPAFFLFIGLEYWITKKKKLALNRTYANAISNISIGIAERLLNLLITGSFFELYYFLYENYALLDISARWYVWITLLLATDLIWYWYHRLGHEINLMWGAHVVHHQSEEFNYTVSARITTLQAIIRNLFWCILPLMGFHPSMVIAILVIHGTYSFFTHTETIGSLGWLEKFMVTPSHHRVHHASNDKYLNKNYGDIFIFWDKLFGTFQKEEAKPVYGLTHPLKSHSFLWQHFHYYAELWEACRKTDSLWNSLRILFGKPEMLDQKIRTTLERRFLPLQSSQIKTPRFRFYLTTQIIVCSAGVFYFTLFFSEFTTLEKGTGILLVLLTLTNCGAMLEQQRWIFYLEIIRAACINAYFSYAIGSPVLFLLLGTLISMAAISETAEKWYYRMVYQYR